MNKYFKKALAVLLSVILAVSFTAFPLSASAAKLVKNSKLKGEYAEGEVIAVLNDNTDRNYLLAGTSKYGKGIKLKASHTFKSKKSSDLNIAVLKSTTLSTKEMLKQLNGNSGVKYAIPNYKKHICDITNDEYSKYQWALSNTGQNGGTLNTDLNPETLWESAENSDEEQIVAICDTGLDIEHEEFKGRIWNNPYGSKLVGKHGYDFSGENYDGVPRDGNGHGTHCAGIIAAAANNRKGISGINKSNVKIMPLKWLDDGGSGYDSDVFAAYDYICRAIDLGANITAVNNSWGGLGDYSEIELYTEIFDKLGEKGVISVVAAGNESSDISEGQEDFFGFDDELYFTPACNNSRYAITVAATDEKGDIADFSNYSTEYVDVAAPGVDILSTVSYNCFNPSVYSDSKKAVIVDRMQNYDGTVTEDDFGYPEVVMPEMEDTDCSDNLEVSFTDRNFGLGEGKSVTLKTKDKIKRDDYKLYAFEIPFTIDDEDESYSISYMTSALKDVEGYIYDVPASTDIAEMDYWSYSDTFSGGDKANWWSHGFFNSNEEYDDEYEDDDDDGYGFDDDDEDDEDEDEEGYIKDTDRKLVFLIFASEKDSEFILDDLAISKQGVDEEDFEKYDIYNGTSMATPYVTGAAALMKNANSDATTFDVINMLRNIGYESDYLEDKTVNSKLLSLDNTEEIPPMIFKAAYNDKGQIEIDGSFRNIKKVKINNSSVTPVSKTNSKIIINDNNYNTKEVEIYVENDYGSDEISVLLSNKTPYPPANDIIGEPEYVYGGVMLPVDDSAYYINASGVIGKLYYDTQRRIYTYKDNIASVNFAKLFGKNVSESTEIESAAYTNGTLYFTAYNPIVASNGTVIGSDSAFGCINLGSSAVSKLCDLPDSSPVGGSLAAYNGEIYLAGGYDDGDFSRAFYKYNTKSDSFERMDVSLPEGRAYTKFIQYGNTLVGVYGSVESERMPSIITYNGNYWSKSSQSFKSDDCYEYWFGEDYITVYEGNLGYGNGGVFCNGAYVYGRGDSFTYNPNNDSIVNFDYSLKNSFDDDDVIGTTLPGCYFAFRVTETYSELEDISFGKKSAKGTGFGAESGGYSYEDDESSVYKVNMPTSYAVLNASGLKNAVLDGAKKGYTYGEIARVAVKPANGYAVNSIAVNGAKVANGAAANVRLTSEVNRVTASTTLIAPAKVGKIKAKKKQNKVTLKWGKAAGAEGYQVQQLKKGKWKTVKTVKGNKCTFKKLKKGKYQFRVRAYKKYNSKTYYGGWSKVKTVKVK